MRVGCLIGARGRMPLDPLIRLGFFFGAAFQIQDDLLNLEPGPGYGKEINGDLFEGKRTLMIIHALRRADRAERAGWPPSSAQPRPTRSAADVAWVRACSTAPARSSTRARSPRALGGAALYEFDTYFAGIRGKPRPQLHRSLLTWVLQRTH